LYREDILRSLKLDPTKVTVLYAPAFNQGASLQEHGMEIIDLLASNPDYNVIVKFPPDIWEPTSDLHATGGINWFEKIRPLELKYRDNLRVYKDHDNNSLLIGADVLVTCISGIAFDFLALNKPVIYIDTPKYFEMYKRNPVFDMDPESLANYTLANAGREFGIVIKDIRDLPTTIDYVLTRPASFPRQQERLKQYLLYNRGCAADAAETQIESFLQLGVKSQRPYVRKGGLIENIYKYLIGKKRHIYYSIEIGILVLCSYIDWC
jgi:CDP-glycerol glycerophosphotransferase (TagB/SpsB family)